MLIKNDKIDKKVILLRQCEIYEAIRGRQSLRILKQMIWWPFYLKACLGALSFFLFFFFFFCDLDFFLEKSSSFFEKFKIICSQIQGRLFLIANVNTSAWHIWWYCLLKHKLSQDLSFCLLLSVKFPLNSVCVYKTNSQQKSNLQDQNGNKKKSIKCKLYNNTLDLI